MYDAETGVLRWKAEPHADWLTDLSFSPDGTLLATASRDKSCRVFEVATGLGEASYQDHTDAVYAVAFVDDKTVASGRRDRKLNLWNADDGKSRSTTSGFEGDLLRLSAVGKSIYSVSADGKLREHALDQSADAKPADPGQDQKKKPKAPTARKLLNSVQVSEEWQYAVASDRASGLLAVGGHDGRVHVYRVEGLAPLSSFTASPGLNDTRK